MSPPTCSACGSTRIRRARMREGWHQLVKRHTRLRRYACGQCQHRGWTTAKLPHSEHPEEQEQRLADLRSLPGRPVEARDHRARRQLRHGFGKSVLLAIALGALIALLLGRLGR